MFAKFFRSSSLFFALALFAMTAPRAVAAPEAGGAADAVESATRGDAGGADGNHSDEAAGSHGEGGHSEGPKPVFDPEHGTLFNGVARSIFAQPGEKGPHGPVVRYDFIVVTALLWGLLAFAMVSAARKVKIRPSGKPASLANTVEAAVDGFQNYLGGVMGEGLARKYTPLIASFFFTILVSNWLGLVPGLLAPTAQPGIPIALAIVAFIAVHVIAIKETSVKSWFTHFLGEPLWLAPLNFPLHIVGELIKPLSLSLRLLCNVFGEEAVIVTLTGLAVSMLPIWLPIPFQLPMLFLGTFFGFLQALVFSTLLAIYISILATHHDEHGGHEHTEHAHKDGHDQVVSVASASPVA
ncbi:MAG TPA: F0F1 ATP synthase subunit A [Abditibacterium sp.]|jgi:F-type H+-transporting ATPase subunit a